MSVLYSALLSRGLQRFGRDPKPKPKPKPKPTPNLSLTPTLTLALALTLTLARRERDDGSEALLHPHFGHCAQEVL